MNNFSETSVGYGDMAIIACDNKGAVTVGGACKGLRTSNYAGWGNLSYHVFLQRSIHAVAVKDFGHLSTDGGDTEPLQHVREMLQNLYDFNFHRYLSRKRCTTSWMATAFSMVHEGNRMTQDEWMLGHRTQTIKELTDAGYADLIDDVSGFEKWLIWT